MTYPDAGTLSQSFQTTHWIIRMQTKGLTHADSLLQLPFRGNCLNWVLGHIVAGRNTVLKLLAKSPIWNEGETARYESGSEPIMREEQALPLDRLLHDLDQTQQQITSALEQIAPETLAATVPFRGGERPVGQAVAGQHWHETYHTGQLELLRQLAGTDDALI